jgi:hypothetical protein
MHTLNLKANTPEDTKVDMDDQYHAMKLHGDRGLALVGDERIPLTDEEVCCQLAKKHVDDVSNRADTSAERLTESSLPSSSGSISFRYTPLTMNQSLG